MSNQITTSYSGTGISGGIIVRTDITATYETDLTDEQREDIVERPTKIAESILWNVSSNNRNSDFTIRIEMPKENTKIDEQYTEYLETDTQYIFNRIYTRNKTFVLCTTHNINPLNPRPINWFWYAEQMTVPKFCIKPKNTRMNLTFINSYNPQGLLGNFIYHTKIYSNILVNYHNCLYPEICSYTLNKVILNDNDILNELSLRKHLYKFTIKITKVYYLDIHKNVIKMDFVPINKKMLRVIVSPLNIIALLHKYNSFLNNDHDRYTPNPIHKYLDKAITKKNIEFSCSHDFSNTYYTDNKDRLPVECISNTDIKSIHYNLKKEFNSLNKSIQQLLINYNRKDILKFSKRKDHLKQLQDNIYKSSIELSKERTPFGGPIKQEDTCGICLEKLIIKDDDDFDFDFDEVIDLEDKKLYVLSNCKHTIHLDCLIQMNNSVRDSYNDPGNTWDYDSIKKKFMCPYCRTKLSTIDVITSVSKEKIGILL